MKLTLVGIALLLVGCADNSPAGLMSGVGRSVLAVGTLGISELGIARRKEQEKAIQDKCVQFQGMDNIKCIAMLTPPPAPVTNVAVSPPRPIHCSGTNFGGIMDTTCQ